jgi:hypothetical protein
VPGSDRNPRGRSDRAGGEVHDEQRADRGGEVLGDGEAIAMQADHDAAQRQRGVVDARAEGALAPGCVDGQVRGR